MQYTLIIKNEKTKNYRLLSQLIVLFNLLGFIFLLMNSEEKIAKNIWPLFSIVATAAYSAFSLIELISKKTIPDFWHRSILGYSAVAWTKEGYWWLSILLAIFILFDILAQRKMVVIFTEKKITLHSVPKKIVEWNELNNLMLKDDLLTIDFKNNKLFQHLILSSGSNVNEKEFNDFCKSRLNIEH